MSVLKIIRKIPDYASDIKKNLMEIFSDDPQDLTRYQLYGVALTTAYYLHNEMIFNHIKSEAKLYLEESDAQACKLAVIMTNMLNTYNNFKYSVYDEEFRKIPSESYIKDVKVANIDETDFELYALAVSILNECKYSMDVFTKKLSDKGVSRQTICTVNRIVCVLKAASDILTMEQLYDYDFIPREPSL